MVCTRVTELNAGNDVKINIFLQIKIVDLTENDLLKHLKVTLGIAMAVLQVIM